MNRHTPADRKSSFRFLMPAVYGLVAVVVIWLAGCSSPQAARHESRGVTGVSTGSRLSKEQWVDSVMRGMSVQDKVAQMVLSRAYGYYYSAGSDENQRIERLVKEKHVGGFVFFQGDPVETAVKINQLQSLSTTPLLISSDMEWGAAMRIRRSTRFPEAMALGATRDTMLAFEVGKATGEEARSIGVHQDYAPDADININPDNPVINTRSFGENPELVASMATAFAAGLDSGGVFATAKHFPGHGDTKTDSHIDLPVITGSRARLDSVELVPFKRMVSRNVPSVMIAHLIVPALEPQKGVPSTLSKAIVGGLLQGEMGYKGLVVTDAMEMGAIVNTFGPESSAVRAIEAGVDCLILLPDEEQTITALALDVFRGRIPEARIDRSVRKILGMKWDMGLAQQRLVDIDAIGLHVATPAHLLVARRAARAAITVVKNNGMLPIERFGKKKLGVVVVGDIENYRTEINRSSSSTPNEAVGDYLLAQVKKRYGNTEVVRIDPTLNAPEVTTAMKKLTKCDQFLFAVYSKARSGSGKLGLDPVLLHFLDTLATLEKPTSVLAMGSPYTLKAFPAADALVCGYSDSEVMNDAVVEVVFGEVGSKGKLPVGIPDVAPYGTGLETRQSTLRLDQPESAGFSRTKLTVVDSIVNRAISDSAFPGAQVLVAKDGGIVYNKSFGHFTFDQRSNAVNGETMYDMASVTKVVATTSAIMRLYDEGKIALDDSVVKYIPDFGNHGKEGIRLRNLLVHNGGLPPFKRMFLTCSSAKQALDTVYQTEMVYAPGDSTVYSDFDFILLGKIIERVSGATLNRYVDSVFFHPLRMDRTMYVPASDLISNIAPTEYDSLWRKKQIQGIVHDENCDILGGVTGHAGLFSTASDVAILMQMLMNGGSYGGRNYIKPQTIAMFTSRQSSQSTRALGWDTKTMNGYSMAGQYFSGRSYGHSGFTGTCIWVDPTRNLLVVFLTNRVYPTRANNKISKVRPVLHDAVVRALTEP